MATKRYSVNILVYSDDEIRAGPAIVEMDSLVGETMQAFLKKLEESIERFRQELLAEEVKDSPPPAP